MDIREAVEKEVALISKVNQYLSNNYHDFNRVTEEDFRRAFCLKLVDVAPTLNKWLASKSNITRTPAVEMLAIFFTKEHVKPRFMSLLDFNNTEHMVMRTSSNRLNNSSTEFKYVFRGHITKMPGGLELVNQTLNNVAELVSDALQVVNYQQTEPLQSISVSTRHCGNLEQMYRISHSQGKASFTLHWGRMQFDHVEAMNKDVRLEVALVSKQADLISGTSELVQLRKDTRKINRLVKLMYKKGFILYDAYMSTNMLSVDTSNLAGRVYRPSLTFFYPSNIHAEVVIKLEDIISAEKIYLR